MYSDLKGYWGEEVTGRDVSYNFRILVQLNFSFSTFSKRINTDKVFLSSKFFHYGTASNQAENL